MLNGIGTVCAFIAFLAICLWAYSPRKKKQFDEAAMLPFADEPSFTQNNPPTQDTKNGDTLK